MEYFTPLSWENLKALYEGQGLKNPIRYRMCTGKEGAPHTPTLMEPSDEDLYEGPTVLKCSCDGVMNLGLKRDCPRCCEKCHDCGTYRKHVLAFDYLPFGPQSASMCNIRTTCFNSLKVWRQRKS